MTDLQAALGLCQLEALGDILMRRRRLAERYNDLLADVPGIEQPYDPPYARRTWQSYCVRVQPGSAIGRTERCVAYSPMESRRDAASWPFTTRAPTRAGPRTL